MYGPSRGYHIITLASKCLLCACLEPLGQGKDLREDLGDVAGLAAQILVNPVAHAKAVVFSTRCNVYKDSEHERAAAIVRTPLTQSRQKKAPKWL